MTQNSGNLIKPRNRENQKTVRARQGSAQNYKPRKEPGSKLKEAIGRESDREDQKPNQRKRSHANRTVAR